MLPLHSMTALSIDQDMLYIVHLNVLLCDYMRDQDMLYNVHLNILLCDYMRSIIISNYKFASFEMTYSTIRCFTKWLSSLLTLTLTIGWYTIFTCDQYLCQYFPNIPVMHCKTIFFFLTQPMQFFHHWKDLIPDVRITVDTSGTLLSQMYFTYYCTRNFEIAIMH